MAIGDTKKLGNVGGKTLAFYLVTTAVAVAVALGIGTLLRPGIGLDMSKIQVNASDIETMESTSLVQTILNIIPDNPIKSLASGEMLQIIVFALIIGVILAKLGERAETVSNFISQFNDIMMEMTMMVMSLAPIGVFSLIARTFATIGFSAFVPLAKYMIAVLIALAIQCFGVYQILLKLFTGLNPVKFIRKFSRLWPLPFPLQPLMRLFRFLLIRCTRRWEFPRRFLLLPFLLVRLSIWMVLPLCRELRLCSLPRLLEIQLTPMDYITVIGTATLASIGTAGIPSVGLVTLTMVFNSVGLPVEAIGIIMGIDRILDMARTAVNITGDAVCTTIVACQNGAVDKEVFNKAE